MHRRQLLAMASACAATGLPACAGPSAAAPQAARTHWDIRLSEGFDALAFLGPLSGKDFYTRYYRAELAAFAPRLGPPALAALADLNRDADAAGSLLWPGLTLVFSGSRTDSLADLLASLDAAEVALLPPFKASAYWDEDDWRRFMASRTRLATVLNGLRDADFGAFRAGLIGTAATQRLASLRKLCRAWTSSASRSACWAAAWAARSSSTCCGSASPTACGSRASVSWPTWSRQTT